jgi:hypothetical protein
LNLLRLLVIGLCLLPYAYIYGSQIYRNRLCNSEGLSDIRFSPEAWARQYPSEAAAIRPASAPARSQTGPSIYLEQLNSRFALIEQYRDRGLSVTEKHLRVVDQVTGKNVAEVREFSVPSGNGMRLIDFGISSPQVCNTWPQYNKLFTSLYRMGYEK